MASQDDFLKLWHKKEPLHKELRPYVSKHPTLGKILRHPLVFHVPFVPAMNALANANLQHKKEYREKCRQEKNWSSYVFIHERPYRLQAFCEIMSDLTDREYWELLGSIWSDSENIWQYKDMWDLLLKSTRPEREYFMDEDERKFFSELPEEITVYRGCQVGRNEKGLSWTLDEKRAKWFSTRLLHKDEKDTAKVVKKTVKKADVFAYLSGRKEEEIILLG